MLIDNVMLMEHKAQNSEVRKCGAQTINGVHTTKNMGCVLNVCTHKQLMGRTSIHPLSTAHPKSGRGGRSFSSEPQTSLSPATSAISDWGIPRRSQAREKI